MRPERSEGDSGPVAESTRITSLDLIRGVAVLGILLMNAVSFKFGRVPYLNLSAGGSETWLDWSVGVFGEIFIDQKFMGLFSLLFGAGILLFIERAESKDGRPILLNLWRNALLLAMGILHALVWDGDVLTVYAISSLFLIAFRKLPAKGLIALGAGIFLLSVPSALLAQYIADTTDVSLAGLWSLSESNGDEPLNDAVGGLLLFGYFLRGLGMILMGAGLYRLGFMNGRMSPRTYKMTAAIGIGAGLSLATASVVVSALGDYARSVAFIGQVPNTLGTIPASLGYMSLVVLWDRRPDSWLKLRLRAVGRMALTNYLSQTLLGVAVLTVLLGDATSPWAGRESWSSCWPLRRPWALQLWWSQAWLDRFLFGPAEWLWRVGTYRRSQPLRRP